MNSLLRSPAKRAEQLHADAVVAGNRPSSPYAFVRAEVASAANLWLRGYSKGDIRLFGARAAL